MNNYFKGYYYKHQKNDYTISFIPGISNNHEFIQIITSDNSYYIPYIKGNIFSKYGIMIDINYDNISIKGKIQYEDLHPIKRDIMGPFKYFPMECKHEIVSMNHKLNGSLIINKKFIDFKGGNGYIEGDYGKSFPKEYIWVQSNDLPNNTSIMVSIANIPFMNTKFKGCICIIYYNDEEYRMASYLGARIIKYNQKKIIIKQGKYLLVANINNNKGYNLKAPYLGEMKKTIIESTNCNTRFRFYKNKRLIFDYNSKNSTYEYVK